MDEKLLLHSGWDRALGIRGAAPAQNLQSLDNGRACLTPMASMKYGQAENAGFAYGSTRSTVGAPGVLAELSFPDCTACRTLSRTDIVSLLLMTHANVVQQVRLHMGCRWADCTLHKVALMMQPVDRHQIQRENCSELPVGPTLQTCGPAPKSQQTRSYVQPDVRACPHTSTTD